MDTALWPTLRSRGCRQAQARQVFPLLASSSMVTRGFHPQRPEHSAVAEPADYEFQCGHTHPSGFTCKSAVADGPVFNSSPSASRAVLGKRASNKTSPALKQNTLDDSSKYWGFPGLAFQHRPLRKTACCGGGPLFTW